METMVVESFAPSILNPSPTPSRTSDRHVPHQPPPLPPPEIGYESDSESSDDGWDLNHPTRVRDITLSVYCLSSH